MNGKKVFALFLCTALAVSLTACKLIFPWTPVKVEGPRETIPTQAPAQTQPATTEPVETTAAAIPEMTFQEFVAKAEGIWIFEGTIYHAYEDQYSCEVLTIGQEYVGTAAYPGGADRPGKITEYKVIDENTAWLGLTYEAGEFMGDYLPEVKSEITVRLVEDGKIAIRFGQGDEYTLLYGGQSFDEVNATAKILMGA